MNKQQIKQRITEMLNTDKSFKVLLNKEIDKLLNSGFINIVVYENDYRLSKLVLYLSLKRLCWQYHPLCPTPEEEKLIKNYY